MAHLEPACVRAVHHRPGRGGQDRLALELCEHAEQAGWTAGFAQYGEFPEFVKRAAEWRWSDHTLVVIDHAAAFARDLRAWLEILARPEAQSDGKKLRLLLLERHAECDLGWWADLILYEPGRLVTELTGWIGDRFGLSAGGACRCHGKRPVKWTNGRSLSLGFWPARMR